MTDDWNELRKQWKSTCNHDNEEIPDLQDHREPKK